ncbi:hypothetical protein Vretifemale_8837, partial [Volvox reticuliferus]
MGRPQRSSTRKRKQPGSDEDDGGGEAPPALSPAASDPQRDAGAADASEPSAEAAAPPGEEGATAGAAAVGGGGGGSGKAAASAAGSFRRRLRKDSAAAAVAAAVPGPGTLPAEGGASPAGDVGDGASRQRAAKQKNVKYQEEKEYEWERAGYKEGGGGKRRRSGKGREKEEKEEEEDDAWDTHCKVCASDDDAQKLLCCDGMQQLGCTAVYHMYCLDPPLTRLPAGDWYCPACAHKFNYQEIEKVLDFRDVPRAADSDSPTKPAPQGRGGAAAALRQARRRSGGAENEGEEGCKPEGDKRRLYYVKWKGESYMHCSWEPEEDLAKMYRMFPAIKAKVQRFWKLR